MDTFLNTPANQHTTWGQGLFVDGRQNWLLAPGDTCPGQSDDTLQSVSKLLATTKLELEHLITDHSVKSDVSIKKMESLLKGIESAVGVVQSRVNTLENVVKQLYHLTYGLDAFSETPVSDAPSNTDSLLNLLLDYDQAMYSSTKNPGDETKVQDALRYLASKGGIPRVVRELHIMVTPGESETE